MSCFAIIAAAGSSTRACVDKIWIKTNSGTVLERACLPFIRSALVDGIVVCVTENHIDEAKILLSKLSDKPVWVISGGENRTETIKKALFLLEKDKKEGDIVAIHDGARPFVSQGLIEKAILTAKKEGSAIPVIAEVDSLRLKTAAGSAPIDRSNIVRVQTPQCFSLDQILTAYKQGESATDDATLYEKTFGKVCLIEGEYQNSKITYSSDVYALTLQRVGVGYDVHQLVENRRLILGGITIPFEKGLLGHSDADVLTHAIMDAVLTAAGEHDIGHMFPDTDDKWLDANSIEMLKLVIAKIAQKGLKIGNISATIIAERPKLAPYLLDMANVIAVACQTKPENISIAATTTEGLGITGEGKGMAATATALLVPIM